jgi:hypothetical protein
MSIRNFWITANVDGQATRPGFGPRSKDGGLHLKVQQRRDGSPFVAFEVSCFANEDGTLRTVISGEDGMTITEIVSCR